MELTKYVQAADSAEAGSAFSYNWIKDAEAVLLSENDTQMLDTLSALLASVTEANAGLVFQSRGESRTVPVARTVRKPLPQELSDQSAVAAAADEAVKNASLHKKIVPSTKGDFQYQVMALPAGVEDLVLVTVTDRAQESRDGDQARLMQIAVVILKQYQERKQSSKLEAGFSRASVLLEMLYRAGQIPQFQRAMTMLADETQRFAQCHQVAIGIGDKSGCRLRALSGQHVVDRLSHPNVLLRNFMREAIAVERPISWPPLSELTGEIDIAGNADELLSTLKVDVITALPLTTEDGKQIGAWVCLWKDEKTGLSAKWKLIEALTPHLAAITQLVIAGKPRGLKRLWVKLLDTGRWARRLLALLISAGVIAAMFIEVPYPITVDCRLEPQVTRQAAAPFEGILEASMVKTGDLVRKNQVLAVLDGKEIGWRLSELKAKREVVIRKRDQAMAISDVAAVQLAELDLKSAELEVNLLEHRRAKLEVRSPIDGLVMSGDLAQSRGVPVSLGQKLFDIASIDTLRVQLAVPDMDFAHAAVGMPVKMRLESQVKYGFEMELEAIYPASESVDGKNVFVGIAKVDNESGWLRPGMRGKARIYSEEKSLGWILFHKPWEFVRLNLWM